MNNIPNFDLSELQVKGNYPDIESDIYYGLYGQQIYNTPISPRENYIRFLNREPIYWIPNPGHDCYNITTNIVPDNRAFSMTGGRDSLGALWIADKSNPELPAMVDNNNFLLDDIADWKQIQWPNLDDWDWEKAKNDYAKLDRNQLIIASIPTGLNERLASVVGFTNGLMSYLEDPDSVGAFFDRLQDHNIDMIEHIHKYLNPDMIMFLDDWGSQQGPMFSINVAEELMLPHMKALTDRTHSLGMKFLHHCCGNVTALVPVMIEAGIDQWQFNYEAVKPTIKETIDKYGDQILFDSCLGVRDPLPLDNVEFKTLVESVYQDYCSTGTCTFSVYDFVDRGFDLREYLYETERNIALKILK